MRDVPHFPLIFRFFVSFFRVKMKESQKRSSVKSAKCSLNNFFFLSVARDDDCVYFPMCDFSLAVRQVC